MLLVTLPPLNPEEFAFIVTILPKEEIPELLPAIIAGALLAFPLLWPFACPPVPALPIVTV
jgi:hypothetical protein